MGWLPYVFLWPIRSVWFSPLLGGIAAAAFWRADHEVWAVLAGIAACGEFWSHRIMHKQATAAVIEHRDIARELSIRPEEMPKLSVWVDSRVSNPLTRINMVFSVAILFLVIGAGFVVFS